MESRNDRKNYKNECTNDVEKYFRHVEFISNYQFRLSKEECIVSSGHSKECLF